MSNYFVSNADACRVLGVNLPGDPHDEPLPALTWDEEHALRLSAWEQAASLSHDLGERIGALVAQLTALQEQHTAALDDERAAWNDLSDHWNSYPGGDMTPISPPEAWKPAPPDPVLDAIYR